MRIFDDVASKEGEDVRSETDGIEEGLFIGTGRIFLKSETNNFGERYENGTRNTRQNVLKMSCLSFRSTSDA